MAAQHLGRPGITRRAALAGGAAALTALTLRPALAIGRLVAGDGELMVLSDGTMTFPTGFSYPDVAGEEIARLLQAAGQDGASIVNHCNVTLFRSGDRLTMFDVGAGPNFLPTTGKLADSLAEAGIDPAEVTDVVFTHAHPDHLWGLTDDFDELVFAEARCHMAQAEWDFWSAPGTVDALPEDRKTFAVGAQNRFAAIEDRVSFFRPGDEVVPGVEAVDTAGHTPGHVSFMLDGSDPVLVAGDAVTNVVVSLERPDWPSGSDQDPEKGAKTRQSLLDRLAGEKSRIVGFHFPHPGAGRIEKTGNGYRLVEA